MAARTFSSSKETFRGDGLDQVDVFVRGGEGENQRGDVDHLHHLAVGGDRVSGGNGQIGDLTGEGGLDLQRTAGVLLLLVNGESLFVSPLRLSPSLGVLLLPNAFVVSLLGGCVVALSQGKSLLGGFILKESQGLVDFTRSPTFTAKEMTFPAIGALTMVSLSAEAVALRIRCSMNFSSWTFFVST